MSASEPPQSYQQLVALVARLAARVETLEAENAELRRRLGMNSTNSSTPPSKDSIEAKARRRVDRSSRDRSADRQPGGQPGHQGSGLAPSMAPDRTETLPPPGACGGCGGDLADAADAGMSWAQVWDILAVTLEKVHYLLPRRRCGCGKITTAVPPFGSVGTVVYGPSLNAAAILLASEGNVPLERTAMLIQALFRVPVSTGFVARALQRLAQRLTAAGFDDAMKTALRAEEVLCTDETPTNVISNSTDAHGQPAAGSPHAVTVRTPDARLVYYAPIGSRSKTALAGLGVLEGYAGYLVRDDYAGYHQFDAQLAGVQQCAAHLIRHCKGVLELHSAQQNWASEVITVLREAAAAVTEATTNNRDQLDPDLLAGLRRRYDHAVAWGITTNRHRTWAKGNHPGYTLAKRLADKADQVFTFTRNLAVPWTNNSSEQALKGPKRHQAVSGYWHTLTTLANYCRGRSYLVSTRGHGIRPIDAIHAALTGNPWLPTASTA
ncbi:MAG: IS66 family transposase [Pseudonocardiales bacterium]|nr:IS66 family transposase [Pseudonocardiales bacterium]